MQQRKWGSMLSRVRAVVGTGCSTRVLKSEDPLQLQRVKGPKRFWGKHESGGPLKQNSHARAWSLGGQASKLVRPNPKWFQRADGPADADGLSRRLGDEITSGHPLSPDDRVEDAARTVESGGPLKLPPRPDERTSSLPPAKTPLR
jgi:hypothetical protein